MDFTGRIVLSMIEEDNTQRAYFRIRPLLSTDGPLSRQDIDQLPDEGYLRIVPDKNEQHTFKERMRELGTLCVLDLYNIPADTVKIRSNKNYSPQRGENNQYIVYSDAVQAVPQTVFYEVITAEMGDKAKIAQSGTPLCYVRYGGRIYGPVSRGTGLEQEGAGQLPPDSEGIYEVTMPDGAQRLFYCPRSENKTVKAAPQSEQETDRQEIPQEENQPKLSGMPLYQTVARRQSPQRRAHNPLIEAVDQQMRAGRVEAPGAVLSAGAATRQVETPMETFKRALGVLWPMQDMQRQAVAHMLSMTGVQNILNQQLAGRGTDAVTAAMNSQIQDLEAERLSLIMQLDSAKKQLSSLKKEALEQLTREEEEQLRRVRQEIADARADMEKVNAARAKLLEERDAIVSEMTQSDSLQMTAPIGGYADLNTLCERVCACLKAKGAVCSWDDAVHLLTLYCVCDGQMELQSDTPSDALAAAEALAGALGAACIYDEGGRKVHVQAGGDGCRLLVSHESVRKTAAYVRVLVALPDENKPQAADADYAVSPWPVAYLQTGEGWKQEEMPPCPPVKESVVREAVLRQSVEPPRAALKLIDDVDKALQETHAKLPQNVRRAMYAYLSAAAVHMEGGAAKAMDYAVSAWIVPHLKRHPEAASQVKTLCGGLPRTLALLSR